MHTRDLSSHTEYVPGRGVEEVARELGLDPADLVKLSSNENPHGASPEAVRTVRDHAEAVSIYPKAAHTDLAERLADRWDLTPSQVWLGPGADGAIDYLSRAVLDPGDEVLVPTPGFSYYGMSARYHHGTPNTYELRKADDFAMDAQTILSADAGERAVYVTSPHNPTGAVMAREELEALLDGVDDETLVVVDEAYAEFSEEPSAIPLLDSHDNLAVLRTFSKAYGLAGLRIGYACVPAGWADAYTRVSTPFAASQLALRAAMAALDDDDHVERTVETARWAREHMRDHLDARTWESHANFVLAEVGDGTAVTERAREDGVIVRDCTSFGLPACIRISCGRREETKRAVEVVNEAIAEVGVEP